MNRSNDLSWGQGETKSGMALFRKCWDILRVSDRILGVDDLQNISSLFSYNQHTYIHSVSWYWPLSITSQNICVVLRAILTWLPSVQLTISRPAGRPEKPQPWLQPSFRLQQQVRVWRKPGPGPRSDIGGFGRELNVIQFDLLREFSLPPPGPGLNTVVLAPSGACHRQYPLVPKYSSSHNLRSYETLQIPASCCNHTITITIIKTDIQHNTRNLNDLIFNMRLDSNAS